MSFVLDVPVQLFMTFLLALPAGQPVQPARESMSQHAKPKMVRAHQAFGEGAFKFGEQAWLKALKVQPAPPNVQRYAGRIFKTSTGLYYVPKANERRAILALRDIPAIAQGAAARLAQHNARQLRQAFGRPADTTELYLAHRLGVEAAASLVRFIKSRPNEPAYFYVAKVAPNFLIEDLVTSPDATLAELKSLLQRSLTEAKRKAASQNLLQALRPSLRDSFAALVANRSRATNFASASNEHVR